MIEHLAILAPGLLGASVAKAARARNAARHISIWARRPETRVALRSQPFADTIADTPADAVRNAQLTVLAAPVEQIIDLAAHIAPALKPGAIVTDVGSVKTRICRECAAAMPAHASFVGSHPMAGGSSTGWQNATDDLFIGRVVFITPAPQSQPPQSQSTQNQSTQNQLSQSQPPQNQNDAGRAAQNSATVQNSPPVQSIPTVSTIPTAQSTSTIPTAPTAQATTTLLSDFWRALGANPVILAPGEHDEIVAHISHLPQAIATTLASFLAQKNPAWGAFAGNGLRDTTRIAASDANMWIEIFQQNRAEILKALDTCQAELAAFRAALDQNNWPGLRARLDAGKKFRDSL